MSSKAVGFNLQTDPMGCHMVQLYTDDRRRSKVNSKIMKMIPGGCLIQ